MKKIKTLLTIVIIISAYALFLLCVIPSANNSKLNLLSQSIKFLESPDNSDIKNLTRRYKNLLTEDMNSSKKYVSAAYEVFGKVQGWPF